MRTIEFRPADMQDAPMLLEWRNDPETRKWSTNSKAVDPVEHEAWLGKTILSESSELLIGVYNLTPVGTVRLDEHVHQKGNTTFVSITVAPEVRGQGYGKLMLEAACLRRASDTLAAIIHKKNDRSIKLFEGCGFCFHSDGGTDGVTGFRLYAREPLLL